MAKKKTQANQPAVQGLERLAVGKLNPGEDFKLRGEEFRLDKIEGDVAKIMLLEKAEIKVSISPDITKVHFYGVARAEIPASTLVEKLIR